MTTPVINPRAPRFLRFATSAPVSVRAEGDRTIDHIFSDESVARDGDTIASAGWKLDNFLKNPVYLWAHDSLSPPIGRVTKIAADGALLRATVQYADADAYPFADTIFRLTKGGYINASSVSWLPIKWRYAADKGRAPGAIDFLEQELLEASAVPLPALASALVSARGAGIDTGPIFDWATQALDVGGFAVLPRRDLETLRKDSRMPTASHAEEPEATSPPVEPAVKADRAFRAQAKTFRRRGLGELSQLCDLLGYAEHLYNQICDEAEDEGDGSPIPDRLAAWLDEGNAIIAAMADEETQENLKGAPADEIARAVKQALSDLGLTRSGKVLSKENARCLRSAHDHMETARCLVRSVMDKNGEEPDDENPEESDTDGDSDDARALRVRKAHALKRRVL
jgi:hypothetical protein